MRLRHIPGSEDFVREAASVVNAPERYRGNWSTFFRKEAPLALEIVERLRADGAYISASRVRELIAAGNLDAVRPLVPPTTFAYLQGGELPALDA